jgi:hypothetical protein
MSYLPTVVCRRVHVLFTLFACLCIVVSNTYGIVFLFCFSPSSVHSVASFSVLCFVFRHLLYTLLPVSLCCVLFFAIFCTLCCQFLCVVFCFSPICVGHHYTQTSK